MNDAGPVQGVVIGAAAVIVVTSVRNGAIVMGTAKLSKKGLQWQQIKEIKSLNPEGDSSLIFGGGSLTGVRR